MGIYNRSIQIPGFSFFLFGPRGTGKSTWLKQNFKSALYLNLNLSRDFLPLARDSAHIHDLLTGMEAVSSERIQWCVIDEIQKLPTLLSELQETLSEPDQKVKFAFSGSSARKLKRIETNLLAGRARVRRLFPLVSEELGFDIDIESILKFGNLPLIHTLKNKEDKIDYLDSYAQTYLNEEIKQEAVVRKLEPFVRFLSVSSLLNGQIWNVSEISRDVGVARTTVEGYLSILIDTLIVDRIEGFKLQAKVKEKSNPKFYFFDPGVVRALSSRLHQPLDAYEKGYLLETWILNELQAFASYNKTGGKVHYWGTPSQIEVDFIYTSHSRAFGIEIKNSKEWRSGYNKGLNALMNEKKIIRGIGLYRGNRVINSGGITVYPILDFLKKLWKDEIFI